jgi:hypothetical protein
MHIITLLHYRLRRHHHFAALLQGKDVNQFFDPGTLTDNPAVAVPAPVGTLCPIGIA